MFEKIKRAARLLIHKLEYFFEWVTDRWYRVAAYFSMAMALNVVGLIVDFSWFWLATTVVATGYGVWLARVAWLNEQDMIARVEEALAEVDFNDTSRWIGPDDEGYPKRPQR